MHDGKEVLIAPSIPWPVSGPSAKLIFGDSRLQENKGIQGVLRRLCSQIPDSFLCRNMQRPFRYSMNGNRTELEQVVQSHTSNIAPERLAVRVWCTKSQSSLLNILLPSQWIPVLAPTYSLLLRSEYLFTLHPRVVQNLFDM